MSARKLTPTHIVECTACGQDFVDDPSGARCPRHPEASVLDMGYRVGEASANYTWYSTLERAWTDRRCK